jgi:hypothetical protein
MRQYTLREFNHLSLRQKYDLLEDYGIFLEVSYLSGSCQIALFSLFDYYVQVELDCSNERLKSCTAFTSYKKLDPFLKEIDLRAINHLLKI